MTSVAMPDMLVKLYDLPHGHLHPQQLRDRGVVVRRAMPYEKGQVVAWVRAGFGDAWAGECDVAFSNHPLSCFIAVDNGRLAGFACHDSTCRNFFGPMGVAVPARNKGIGSALLASCLRAMAANGYAYAIIGGVANGDIYRKVAGAVEIEGSTPGIYRDRLGARADARDRT
jgi:GNAT superfamily N-acetyltransferase